MSNPETFTAQASPPGVSSPDLVAEQSASSVNAMTREYADRKGESAPYPATTDTGEVDTV